jgi:hypothetical protein
MFENRSLSSLGTGEPHGDVVGQREGLPISGQHPETILGC